MQAYRAFRRVRLPVAFVHALVAGVLFAGSAQAQLLGPRTDLDTGPLPRNVAVADLDADGNLDLVATVQGAGELSIFRGNGDGTFQPRSDRGTHPGPVGLAVADWTGDGKLDLLVGAASDTTITLYIGDGLGGFTTGASVDCPTIPYEMVVADVTGDGLLDIIVAADEPTVAVFDVPGAPGGGFAVPRILVSEPGARSRGLAVGQIDGVAGLDVYCTTTGSSSRLLRNNGAGGFLAPVSVGGSGRASGVALADVDGDGDLDALEAGIDAGGNPVLRLLLGSPGGSFVAGGEVAVGTDPRSPVLADFNRDGKLDAACVNLGSSAIAVSLRDCGFGVPSYGGVDFDPVDLALGDFDEDGDPDFVSANGSGASLSIRRNDGAAVATCVAAIQLPVAVNLPADLAGISVTTYIRVRSVGTLPLTLTGATVTHPAFTVLSVPTDPIPPGGFADITFRADRLGLGTASDLMRIESNATANPVAYVPISVQTREPSYPTILDPGALVFGEGPVGVPETRSVQLFNLGDQPLQLTNFAISGAEFELPSSAPVSIGASSSGSFAVRYLHSEVGYHTGSVSFSTNDPQRPVASVPLSGSTRLPKPIPALNATSFIFGANLVGLTSTHTLNVHNFGELPFQVVSVTSSAPTLFSIVGFVPTSVAPGAALGIVMRYERPALGTHSAVITVVTDAPGAPNLQASVSGQTIFATGEVYVGTPGLDYGTAPVGQSEDLTVQLRNVGAWPLTIDSVRTSSPEFTLPFYDFPKQLTANQLLDTIVRYRRLALGALSESVLVFSNDVSTPRLAIPLVGAAVTPPSAALFAGDLVPVTLAPGASTTRNVTIFNDGEQSSLSVEATAVLDSIGTNLEATWAAARFGGGEVALDPVGFPQARIDGAGHVWDILAGGEVDIGDPGAFTLGIDRLDFPDVAGATLADGGRTLVLENASPGLRRERKVHVSPFEGLVRYLDSFENTGVSAVTCTLRIRSDIDNAFHRTALTSSGDAAFEAADDWLIVQDDVAPAVVHVVAGPGGALRPSLATLTNSFRTVRYEYVFTLAPGAIGSILHFGVQAADLPEAIDRAGALRAPFGPALVGLSGPERARILNFSLGSPFSLPLASLTVDPLQSRLLPVLFDAPTGAGEETSFGTLRLQTTDLEHPLFVLPLELHVTGEGTDVLDAPPSASLALAARFVPNPAVGRGLRLSYALPTAGEARFELYDVRGRRIDARVLPDAAAGPGTLDWSGGGGGAGGPALAPGVYWTRLTHAGRSVVTKGVVLR